MFMVYEDRNFRHAELYNKFSQITICNLGSGSHQEIVVKSNISIVQNGPVQIGHTAAKMVRQ